MKISIINKIKNRIYKDKPYRYIEKPKKQPKFIILRLILSVFTAIFSFPLLFLLGPLGFIILGICIFILYNFVYEPYDDF